MPNSWIELQIKVPWSKDARALKDRCVVRVSLLESMSMNYKGKLYTGVGEVSKIEKTNGKLIGSVLLSKESFIAQ